MKAGFIQVILFLLLPCAVWAEPLFTTELPSERVRDEGQFLSTASRAILSDSLDTLARTQQVQVYVVILQNESLAEATKLSDRWQAEWVPKGMGGVFVYSVPEKKYCFTPTKETLEAVGAEKLQALFLSAVENPPLRESLDVVISVPVFRIVAAVGQSRIEVSEAKSVEAESQTSRWELIALIVGIIAAAGWILYVVQLILKARRDSTHIGIPPEGLAYRNPPRKSRSGRRSRSEGGEEEGGERRARRDRY